MKHIRVNILRKSETRRKEKEMCALSSRWATLLDMTKQQFLMKRTDCDSDVSLSEGDGVVDAVADHHHTVAARLELLDLVGFLGSEKEYPREDDD